MHIRTNPLFLLTVLPLLTLNGSGPCRTINDIFAGQIIGANSTHVCLFRSSHVFHIDKMLFFLSILFLLFYAELNELIPPSLNIPF